MPRRIILLFAFLGVFAALGMSWHVHTSAVCGPEAPNCPAEFYSLFSVCEDAADDDAMKSAAPTPIEIQFRVVAFDTLDRRCFTYVDEDVPVVRGVLTEESVFQLLNGMQGERHCHIMQVPKVTRLSGVPFGISSGVPVGAATRFGGLTFKGNATARKDGRIHLHMDATHSDPMHIRTEHPIQFVNAKGSFVLESGQTCFLGGLKRRNISTESTPLPLLSEMPWIGDWFVLSRTVETDMELMFLATVRIGK